MGNKAETPIAIGYRVMSIDESGPMFLSSLIPILDFIIYPDTDLDKEESVAPVLPFEDFITQNANKEIELMVYNMISQSFRKIKAIPNVKDGKGYLGIKVRPENYHLAHIKVLHVLKCLPNGPLEKAGAVEKEDYLLGTDDRIFSDLDEFKKFLIENNGKEVEFLVYNTVRRRVRKVAITPNSTWGGEGYLGGDIGYGISHAIPKSTCLLG